MNSKRYVTRRVLPRRKALVAALAVGMGISGLAYGQATTGTIYGQVPVASGETIQITGGSGYNRTIEVGQSGRYSVTLPVGIYTVTLKQNGEAIQSRTNVTAKPASSVEIDFSTAGGTANAQNLSTITVSANAIPAIDVSSVQTSTVITAQQLQHLPLARSAQAIALLAPGVGQGAALNATGPLGNTLLSFSGSSVAENAHYINGFNTSDPLGNQGGVSLPYGSIQQEQILTSGYDAKYGRSIGGVINQIGKSGTNTWHFGGQILWQPRFAQGTEKNWHYNNPLYHKNPSQEKGQLYAYRNDNASWQTIYDAYLSGPLIKDKLFFFIAAEADKTKGHGVGSVGAADEDFYTYEDPKYYLKLDWNINDNNILSLTGIKNSHNVSGETYNYDLDKHAATSFKSTDQISNTSFKIWVANYTSYITNNLTLHAMYGKMKGRYYTNQPAFPGFDPTLPRILGASSQNPALNGGVTGGIRNSNTNTTLANPNHHTEVTNERLDLDWRLGNHDLQFGIDNILTHDFDDGSLMTGPGYAWEYNLNTPGKPIQGSPGEIGYVAAPGPGGYSVDKYVFTNNATVRVKQRAQYIQDSWQVTPRVLLKIGLRNDQFTNYNPSGQAYLRLTTPQWAPRLGVSWDVFGDSSLKIFANAGRYYLAMPAAVALRASGAATFTREYFTYTGIDKNGIPQGLKPIKSNPRPIYVNNEDGRSPNPRTVASKNVKAEYQDNYVLGMQQQINPSWVYGATARYSKMGRILDDWCDMGLVTDALTAQGVDLDTLGKVPGCTLINPGASEEINVAKKDGGYYHVKLNGKQMGLPEAKRNYYSLELYLEHPWDGKWFGKIDYVFSRSYGNTEGPIQSNIGQSGSSVSITEQWDYGKLMEYANGDQANDRRHTLKAYGAYKIAPEWMVSVNILLTQGTPASCLGFYGPGESDPVGYGGSYHWCGGKPTPPGSTGRTPWLHILNVGAEYRPSWADNKLAFQLQVHNVFNEQKVTQYWAFYGQTAAPNPAYRLTQGMETPRYVQFGISYDY